MNRQPRQSNTGLYALLLIALIIISLMAWLGYKLYNQYEQSNLNPVQQEQVNDLQGQINNITADINQLKLTQAEFKWWPVLRWVLVLLVILIIVLYWIKHHYNKVSDKLTIDKALKLGTEELREKHHYVALNAYGKSLQRRVNSTERVLLLVFSRHQKIPGMASPPHGNMYYAVLNNDWEHRYPSEPGMTFLQFMDHLHDMEVIGFSIEKTEETAGIEYLQNAGQQNETMKKLAGELGLANDPSR